MWRLSEARTDEVPRTWVIEWTGGEGVSGEDLIDIIEDSVNAHCADFESSRVIYWASGISPTLDSGASVTLVAVNDLAGWIQRAMITIAGTPRAKLLIRVSEEEPLARRSA